MVIKQNHDLLTNAATSSFKEQTINLEMEAKCKITFGCLLQQMKFMIEPEIPWRAHACRFSMSTYQQSCMLCPSVPQNHFCAVLNTAEEMFQMHQSVCFQTLYRDLHPRPLFTAHTNLQKHLNGYMQWCNANFSNINST